mgnify:CR=1 FL=1
MTSYYHYTVENVVNYTSLGRTLQSVQKHLRVEKVIYGVLGKCLNDWVSEQGSQWITANCGD